MCVCVFLSSVSGDIFPFKIADGTLVCMGEILVYLYLIFVVAYMRIEITHLVSAVLQLLLSKIGTRWASYLFDKRKSVE